MYTIGITGGTGSGKTSALKALQKLGALALDCDAIYHELLRTNKQLIKELAARFEGVVNNETVDRKRLGEIVFNDKTALQDLNSITHRYVGAQLEREMADWTINGGKIIAIDAISLIESGRASKCDAVIGVTAPKETRTRRIMKRDNITKEQAEMRINAQKPDSFYQENCDFILEGNSNTPEEFEKKCIMFFEELIRGGNEDAR